MAIKTKHQFHRPGFTLLELMISASILIVALSGLLAIFSRLFYLNENARKLTLATVSSQNMLEEIRSSAFSAVFAAYNGASFNPPGFPTSDAKGAISINNSNPDLLEVYVNVSWREHSNRIIGEDSNLNGAIDPGEDLNENGRLDSPAEIVALIGNR